MAREHYLHVVRALLLVAPVAIPTAGCASYVIPDNVDADRPDTGLRDVGRETTVAVDSGACLSMCPTTAPAQGTPCAANLSCNYPQSSGAEMYCYCDHFNADGSVSNCGAIRCSTAVPGPLPPPELFA